jgi:pyruvate dehydrogenase E2 component (dihydrolipoamide acetyltransferase)
MADVVIPSLGIAMEEALLTSWLRQPGDVVQQDDAIAEIETDKATMELTSPVAGVLGPHLFEEGATVPVGVAVATVYSDTDAARAADGPSSTTGGGVPTAAAAPAGDAGAPILPELEGRRLSPRARRAEREQAQREQSATADGGSERFRSLIAEKVGESWREIPHFAVTREVDATAAQLLLAELRAAQPEPSPTLTDLFLRALAEAIRSVDSTSAVDVGLAVATEHGVVIPVVRDVLSLPPVDLSRERANAVERARSGRLGAQDLEATPRTTLSNLGARGVDQFTGIIAVGQTSLLTVGRAMPRAVVVDGAAVDIRTTFHATLNADHRTIDGAGAADLLDAFAAAVEIPGRLFEGVA